MLSPTNSIADIKKYLINQPAEYGYKDDTELVAGISLALENAVMLIMKPAIGESYYIQIAAKDKVNLSNTEAIIYTAECLFGVSSFLRIIGIKESQRAAGINQTMKKSKEGISLGKIAAADNYFREALDFMASIGYYETYRRNVNGIESLWQRNCKPWILS